jgi:hypothetical protein
LDLQTEDDRLSLVTFGEDPPRNGWYPFGHLIHHPQRLCVQVFISGLTDPEIAGFSFFGDDEIYDNCPLDLVHDGTVGLARVSI